MQLLLRLSPLYKRLGILLILGILFSGLRADAQMIGADGSSLSGKIVGSVQDSLSKKPVQYVTVSITRRGGKAPITGNITDGKGNFKLTNIKPGDYTLHIAFIGYTTKNVDVSTSESKLDKNIGLVYLAQSAMKLGNVEVRGKTPLIENRIDKIVYNAEQDVTTTGGNASDVLQKVPLVAVDMNGNVSLRGDGNVRVLINGKPSGATSANLADVLKTIPAAQIKSIEVITSPSAKYDAEGTAGIINIITKQKNLSGFSGSLAGGLGTRQNNGNLNLNFNKNRLSLALNAGGNLSWPQTSLVLLNQNYKRGDSLVQINNNGSSKTKRNGLLSSLTAGYDFNAFNSISTTFKLNQGLLSPDGTSVNSVTNSLDPTQNYTYTGKNASKNKFGGFDWNIDYTHKFKKEGHEVLISTQWSHSTITTDYMNTFFLENVFSSTQEAKNDAKNNEYTVQADYTLPINKVIKLETGAKAIIRKIQSDYSTNNVDQKFNAESTLPSSYSSANLYNYDQTVSAGYAVLTFTLPKGLTLMPGARLENTDIKGMPSTGLTGNFSRFTQNYNTFIPSLTLQQMLTASQTLKVSYSKRISRPSLTFLNPFINASQPNSQTQGNPNLAPELVHSIELNYNAFIHTAILNASLYYRRTSDIIQGITTPLPSNTTTPVVTSEGTSPQPNGAAAPSSISNATLTKYYNIGKSNSLGASLFGSVSPLGKLNIRGSINVFSYQNQSNASFSSEQSKTGTYVAYVGFLSASLSLEKEITVEIFGYTSSKKYTIQGTTPAFTIMGAGAKKQLFHKKASLGLQAINPFEKYLHINTSASSSSFNQVQKISYPLRSFGITFSYSFGKTSFATPQKKKGINNDDMKQDDQNGGMMGAGGQGGGANKGN